MGKKNDRQEIDTSKHPWLDLPWFISYWVLMQMMIAAARVFGDDEK